MKGEQHSEERKNKKAEQRKDRSTGIPSNTKIKTHTDSEPVDTRVHFCPLCPVVFCSAGNQ